MIALAFVCLNVSSSLSFSYTQFTSTPLHACSCKSHPPSPSSSPMLNMAGNMRTLRPSSPKLCPALPYLHLGSPDLVLSSWQGVHTASLEQFKLQMKSPRLTTGDRKAARLIECAPLPLAPASFAPATWRRGPREQVFGRTIATSLPDMLS
ncbi:hypothetical protein JMJ77_0004197 [Colletotrichum scovillei]|uniref:Uncharacterized protein n=1 Tax=Colletotrichum scovillei TaxID=1209932 RepID=A0A9P7QWK4_9PEZI|nr:hypothetical protein JMJ77_0004197 [Colletotrichum scovillei]KAG7049446.1 hypothetical protein JMJ78_0013429 [Colletotrichum scovillei]KAG7064188.1 hypothetical protein JMJ76_0007236 [Colletotrichum scovillei]